MAKKKITTKQPTETATVPDRFYARPVEGESDEAFASRFADMGIAALEADRKKRGLPPMPE